MLWRKKRKRRHLSEREIRELADDAMEKLRKLYALPKDEFELRREALLLNLQADKLAARRGNDNEAGSSEA